MGSTKKPEISYVEFLKVKSQYIKDFNHHLTFGQVLCEKFGLDDSLLASLPSVVAARVRIEELVEWTF